jgi:hypothetical protein
MVNNILLKGKDPLPDIRKVVSDIKSKKVKPKFFKRAIRLNKEVWEYKQPESCQQAVIGKELGLRKGELAEFYDADKRKTGKSFSFDFQDADPKKYLQALWNTLQEVLELVGYSKEELAKEFTVKVATKNKNKKTKKSSGIDTGNQQR